MDELLDYVRIGDNVVFRITDLEEYAFFTRFFVRQAKKDGRNLIYMRFARHRELVSEEDARRYTLDPDVGFESFTVEVHRIMEKEGEGAFYVFDCLSELQVAWAADLMMGNFFSVTCPYLFRLNTVAFFPVMRGCHSYEAIERIQETTQLFLDVFSNQGTLYLLPVKAWNRHTPKMFVPHSTDIENPRFHALTDAVSVTKYYAVVDSFETKVNQSLDSWERYFLECRNADEQENEKICSDFCRMMMTKDLKIRELLKKYFRKKDYYKVKDRMIGTGHVGGKSCGMLLARKIVARELPELAERSEPHDSYYIGDHVFYTFLVHNHLWELRLAQKKDDGYYRLADQMAEGIRKGTFPETIRAKFKWMLEYYGQSPIIVRSSSLLEDGFGNAFAGKYESVFCANQGSMSGRLQALEDAIRTVYASMMSRSALEYRAERGMKYSDEQMSILVQRVSGSLHGENFYPSVGGVGYSRDPYGWNHNIDVEKGMLRLVAGLGTKAVDRTESDYPRIIHLAAPKLTTLSTMDEKVRFSQHYVDTLNLSENCFQEVPFGRFAEDAEDWYRDLISERDLDMEQRFRNRGIKRKVYYGSCSGIVKNRKLLSDMEQIMSVLQKAYDYPVDIEYTVNLVPGGDYVICLLQCRPLQVLGDQGKNRVELPECREEQLLFSAADSSMGVSMKKKLDIIVYVDADAYHRMEYNRKPTVAALISEINRIYKNQGRAAMLLSPGRVGTSSPELGVPLAFSGISGFSAICEYDDVENGYMPELSFGSHMFQDLVETHIFYTALFSSGSNPCVFRPEFLEQCGELQPLPAEFEKMSDVVKVYDVSGSGMELYYDMVQGRTICGCIKPLIS